MQTKEWYQERARKPSLTDTEKNIIRDDWEQLTGKKFILSFNMQCPNCYRDSVILILRAMGKEDNGGYVLKSGIVFRYQGKIYTKDNITAKAAEWFIGQDLSNRDKFIVLARDYDSYDKKDKSNGRGED